jgi:hypothetical protein
MRYKELVSTRGGRVLRGGRMQPAHNSANACEDRAN